MSDFIQLLAVRREQGQTMVEYGLILALVSIVAIVTLVTVGSDVQTVFSNVASNL